MNSLILSQRSSLFYFTDLSSPPKLQTAPRTRTNNPPKKWQQNANAQGLTSKKPPRIKDTTTIKLNLENPEKPNKTPEGDEEIPRDVFNRIIFRVCVFVGVPMVLGYGFLSIFGALREQGYDVPKWMPFLTSFLTFGASCFGIPYGALSTSLDLERDGSVLGFEEAKTHWVEMWEEEDKR